MQIYGFSICHPILRLRSDAGLSYEDLASVADEYQSLYEAGVIDPAKVARVALENAASVAGMFLTTECVIVDHPEEHPVAPMANPGMGGMM